MIGEIVEGQAGGGTDHDVGRVADQGRRAADVGGEDHREQIGIRLDLEFLGDQQGDRHDQQHGGDVVQERRGHRRDQRDHHQNAPGVGVDLLGRPDRQKLEDAGLAGDGDDQHHADQQADGVEVDAANGGFLIEDAEHDHQSRRQQRDDGAVDLLGHHHHVGEREQDGRHPHRVQAEQDRRGGFAGTVHVTCSPPSVFPVRPRTK